MPKSSLSSAEVREMVLLVADAIIAAEPYLSEADRNLGDGDHGLGMARGMNAVKEKLAALDAAATIDKVFQTAGMAMMSSMGGASGVIFGSFYLGGAKVLVGTETFDSSALAKFVQGSCEAIMTRGKAKPGDKTMIDALHPAAAKAQEVIGSPLPDALAAVASAAETGRDDSKAMVATLGRAKTMGDAVIGHPDAGACSVALMLRTMADYVAA
jgi:phosphoenolpyruvate---glycerone phosphotransferase subunit DhaL